MLRNISPLLSPDLLVALYRMGHGDEIVLADAHFPADSVNTRVIRADGLSIAPLIDAILPLFVLDTYVTDPLVMMSAASGDSLDPEMLKGYRSAIGKHAPDAPDIQFIERFAFYDRARSAYAVVLTGETAKYGNIILKKGVTPAE
ncbi:L-fucose mutarotase [Consotaella salsifontis]|uniref:L-fucose mutarotase n=1 Tax=Consotaella salsifontis TaxID=1365950 RepID=A0A1T4LHK6_9HYPH|nr:L-fucose mutarotase [Consotaella salsifontis]SJZ54272.1 L-fucose mutarotase [Consotaella salsifontis]